VNISIIGTGNVGSALGASLSSAGHQVTFTGRDAQKAATVAASASATSVDSTADAVRDAEVIILAVPFNAVFDVAREIAPVVGGKVVIDTTNALTPDYSGVATAGGPSVAEQLADILSDAKIVKAFNTVFAGVQASASSMSETPDALYATDDETARTAFAALASSIGFRPVWVGPLVAARELEAVAFLNIRLQLINGGAWNTAVKLIDPPANAIAA
jgi:predicted dinucleotide-binding enzyme